MLWQNSPGLLQTILTIYLATVGGLIIFALGNKPEPRTASFYLFSCLFMGIIMMLVTGISIYGLVGKGAEAVVDPRAAKLGNCTVTDIELYGGVVASLGLIFLSAFLHGEFSILLSFLQYFFMLPSFVVRIILHPRRCMHPRRTLYIYECQGFQCSL